MKSNPGILLPKPREFHQEMGLNLMSQDNVRRVMLDDFAERWNDSRVKAESLWDNVNL